MRGRGLGIRGLERPLPTYGTGLVEPQWVSDEHGDMLHEMRLADWTAALHGLDADGVALRSVAVSESYLEAMAWQDELNRRIASDLIDSRLATAYRDGGTYAAMAAAGVTADRMEDAWAVGSEGYAGGARDLGLVSVLSTRPRGEKAPRRGRRSLPADVAQRQAALIERLGCFEAGGDRARMAKLRRAVGFSARAHGAARMGHRPDDVRMLTLTYAPCVTWEAGHVAALIGNLRKWHKRNGIEFRYVWVAEIQDGARRADGGARNEVHYHIAMWVPVGSVHLPKPDTCGWWPHGATRIEAAKGAVGYLMHYLKKGNSKNFELFPPGCRTYSVGGLEHGMRRARRWLGLPAFVQSLSSCSDKWVRAPVGFGGWVSPVGEHYPSEFAMVRVGYAWCLKRLRTHGRDMDASGPFSWLSDKPVVSA